MNTRKRLATAGVGVAALLAPLGFAFTTTAAEAAPVKKHNLQVYKQQASITLDAYDPDAEFDGPALVNRKKFTVSCQKGDFAVDGTWTVDKVDDWNDDDGKHVAGDESQVYVTESVGRNGMGVNQRNIWDFSMTNLSPSRAQVTAYVVCLADTTKGGSNPDHDLAISDRFDDGTTVVGTSDVILPLGAACPAGQISVANGWSNYGDGFESTPQIRESWPISTAANRWQLTFRTVSDDPAATSQVTKFHRCLTLKTLGAKNQGAAKPHAHKLFASFDSALRSINKSEDAAVTRDCTASNAAYVSSAFSLAAANGNAAYLGVAPRHRTNAWHYAAKVNGTQVYVGGTCLKLKTGKQVKP
ncbi:MAG: hypothetical protein Q8O61_01860 [Nocardioides sp.]|nr:hypothetical protein [Nocardioides sp.]